MKTSLKMLLILTTAVAQQGAMAQESWVKTSFWKAPVATVMEVNLTAQENISQECEDFRAKTFNADGSPNWITKNPERFARMRRNINQTRFNLSAPKAEILMEAQEEVGSSRLPFYTQKRAMTSVDLKELSKFEVEAEVDSYTEISRKLNLKDSIVEVLRDESGNLVLDVKGLDLTCDLFSGKAHLKGTAAATVYLMPEDSRPLISFYNSKLIPKLRDLFKGERTTRTNRAIRIGYRIGATLQEVLGASEEEQVLHVFKILFQPVTLEASSNVVDVDGQKFLDIESSTEVPAVTVRLGL